MLPLDDVPTFQELPASARRRLRDLAEQRLVRRGQQVLRRGTRGRELLAVASGGLRVEPGGGRPALLLGPGELVGEMSLLTGQPVSAHVLAEKDSHLWSWSRETVEQLLDEDDDLRRVLTDVLVRHLRERQQAGGPGSGPQLALLGLPDDRALGQAWLERLARACERWSPAVRARLARADAELLEEVEGWRAEAPADGLLLLALPQDELVDLRRLVRDGDAVVRHADTREAEATAVVASWGLADHALVRRERPRGDPHARWTFRLDPDELGDEVPLDDAHAPELLRLARWLCRQQVGVALSAGAALGFAHVGVLAELAALGLPVDRVVGTSMGGVAALMYGMAKDGEQAIEKCVWTLGRPHKRSWHWLGRRSLLSDRHLRGRAATIAEGRCLGDLRVPVSVVSTDLVRGEKVVLERGPVAEAFFATGAVPGVLPPVDDGDRVLVDGALVSRLPVDLLPERRCGLRIAVNVIPPPRERAATADDAAELRARMAKPFGFLQALATSWDLLSWWHGARDAADADVLIEPVTVDHSGLDFAESWPELVEAGRDAVRQQADELRAAAGPILATRPTASDDD